MHGCCLPGYVLSRDGVDNGDRPESKQTIRGVYIPNTILSAMPNAHFWFSILIL